MLGVSCGVGGFTDSIECAGFAAVISDLVEMGEGLLLEVEAWSYWPCL